jgi:proline racemase
MMAQLKAMSQVKLRHTGIRRSVGGTPVKEKPSEEQGATGEAALLAAIAGKANSSSDEEQASE